jgi:hypothetical protein
VQLSATDFGELLARRGLAAVTAQLTVVRGPGCTADWIAAPQRVERPRKRAPQAVAKRAAAKTTVAKKTVAKKTVAKKTVAKKTVAKKIPPRRPR